MTQSSSISVADTHPLRKWSFLSIAALYALFAAVASFGVPSAISAWFTDGAELPLRTHYVVWGVLAGLFLPVPAVAVLRRRTDIAPMQQLLGFPIAVVVALVLAFDTENAAYMAMFSAPILLLAALHPRRAELGGSGDRTDAAMLSLAGVTAIPAIGYAVANLRLSADTHYTNDLHGGYAQAGILAIALVITVVVAARGAPGWRIPAWVSVISGAMLGAAGVLYPSDPSSVGRTAGIAVLACALLMTGLILTSDQRRQRA